jgi:hypothetical protein
MIIQRDMMYAGWFSVMGLYGAKFAYSVAPFDAPGFLLFDGKSVDLSEASFPASATTARLTLPTNQRNNEAGVLSVQNPQIYVYGFWGASSGMNTCVWSTPASTSYYLANASSAIPGNLLTADVSGTVPSDFATNLALPAMYLSAAAGTADGAGACAGITEFVNGLKVKPQMMDNGSDAAAGFMGPFMMSNNQAFALTSIDSANYSITATLLPGTLDALSGFKIFKKMGSSDNFPDTFSCQPEVLSMMGFVPLTTSSPSYPVTGQTWAATLPVSAADVANRINLGICPINKSGVSFPLGVYVKSYSFNQQQGPQAPPNSSLLVSTVSSGLSVAGDRGSVVVDSAGVPSVSFMPRSS